jgi:hypothetical protein
MADTGESGRVVKVSKSLQQTLESVGGGGQWQRCVSAGNEVAIRLELLVKYVRTQPRALEPEKVSMGA